jgi:hypothetical protein
MEIGRFQKLRLLGGFRIDSLSLVDDLEADPAGRPALAKTEISGRSFAIIIRSGLSEMEQSVSLYHEVLEAMAVASADPPESVVDFNEGDFEKAAYRAHRQFGSVSPKGLKSMLQSYGFREE